MGNSNDKPETTRYDREDKKLIIWEISLKYLYLAWV
ncbi:hypothetical protein BH11ARM1_BH11ARM1_11600 [soil metagenome]